MTDEHRYAGCIESPPGYWNVRCACGWGVRSSNTKAQAVEAFHRHETGKEWWQ